MKKFYACWLFIFFFMFCENAMAAFDFGGGNSFIHLVAVEETDHAVLHDPAAGSIEMHFDLGSFDGSAPAFGSSWDTDILLSNFSSAASWNDIYLGIYALDNPFVTFAGNNYGIGIADEYADSYNINTAVFTGNYKSGFLNTAYGDAGNPLSKDKGSDMDAYVNQPAFAGGTYGGFVTTAGVFHAEERLDTNGEGSMIFVIGDGTVQGSDAIAGLYTFSIDSEDGSLLVNFIDNDPGLVDPDSDNDGIDDAIENSGPNSGDANQDGVQDSLQSHVASIRSYNGQGFVTLVSPDGKTLTGCEAAENPSETDAPPGIKFDYDFINFTIEDITPGDSTTLTVTLPEGASPSTYYKYGLLPGEPDEQWYEFLYDDETGTGAEISGNVITLYFTDALRGDDEVSSQNNMILDLGAPGFEPLDDDDDDDDGDDDGGGNGCFIGCFHASE